MASKILKSAIVVSTMTFLSRISGLIRDIAFANYLGSGAAADAFFVAFRIPNLFRRIFGEGAFSLAFVPVFSEYHHSRSEQETRDFVNRMLAQLGLSVLAVCVIGMLFSDALISLIAPGFLDEPEKFRMAADALQITFPYLFFISMVAMAAGIFNTYDRFAVPAVTPVLLNLCLITAAVVYVPGNERPALVLAAAVCISGLLQFLLQIPFLKRHAILPVPSLKKAADKSDDGVKRVFKLMLPVIYGSSVAQVNSIINTVLASFLITGSVSWLYYSDRLMEFPLAMFVLAISTVILPNLSKQHTQGDFEQFSRTLDWGLRVVLLIVVPSVIGMFVLSGQLMVTLFQYNEFSPNDAIMSAKSLRAYSFGLIGLALVKVLAPGFFAKQDTKTPVKIGVIAMIANVILALILVVPFKHVGLAGAFSLSACVNAVLLLWLLLRHGMYQPGRGWPLFILRLSGASLIMGIIVYLVSGDVQSAIDASLFERILNLALWIVIGMTSFVILSYAMGLRLKQMLVH